jgi:hypothetical protein
MNDGAGIVTPVASSDDDDGNTDEASRILSLVLWSSSLLLNKALRPLVKRKTRQPKKHIFFPTGFPFLTVMPQQRHEFAMNPRRSMITSTSCTHKLIIPGFMHCSDGVSVYLMGLSFL